MFGRQRRSEPALHAAAERIEDLLAAAASRHAAGKWEGRARHVMTICACVTVDRSPGWMIFDTADGIEWRRRPDDLDDEEMVHGAVEAGGHADPADVLAWLEGDAVDPGEVATAWGDTVAVHALQQWVVDA